MENKKKPWHLFEVYGVELEYMIVDIDSGNVKPLCDEVIKTVTGDYLADAELGKISWSNELVNHVIEIKTTQPTKSLSNVNLDFHQSILKINEILEGMGAKMLPSAVHPWMDPLTETQIWPHEHNEIYSLYNTIFDCRGHGWSNLQSTHINLPFSSDEEFGKLHAAIRLLLPIIPVLSASSPFLDGEYSGFIDGRLEAYRKNQIGIPSIAGKVIPEAVFTKADYYRQIFDPIVKDIKAYDKEGILDKHFLNSRGAIARFDRGAIEIRIIDIQEAPILDEAVLQIIVAVLKNFVNQTYSEFGTQKLVSTDTLAALFLKIIKDGKDVVVDDSEYLKLFGIRDSKLNVNELWEFLLERNRSSLTPEANGLIASILKMGNLSRRMLQFARNPKAGDTVQKALLKEITDVLSICLAENKMFG